MSPGAEDGTDLRGFADQLAETPHARAVTPPADELTSQGIAAAFDTGCDQQTPPHTTGACPVCTPIRARVAQLVVNLRESEAGKRRHAASTSLRARVEAEAEWVRTARAHQVLLAAYAAIRAQVRLPVDEAGRLLHETWAHRRRDQGFHHPTGCDHYGAWQSVAKPGDDVAPLCTNCEMAIASWDTLADAERAAYRASADALTAAIEARLTLPPEATPDTKQKAVDALLEELRPKRS